MISAGAAKLVGKAELWHGPGELCGGAAEGLGSLDCFGSSSVLRNRCGHCLHLLSVVTGVLVSAMSCFSLQAEELCSAPGPCCWEVACKQLEGPQPECWMCDVMDVMALVS